MACDITRGRLEPCKESVGGLNAVYFVNYGDLTPEISSELEITTVGTSVSLFKFDLRGTSSYSETINSSRENGTTFYEQVLELTLNKLTKEDHKTIKVLAAGRPHIVVEDNNGNLFMAGLEYGADLTGGTIVTGGAMGDNSGYTLSFTGMEKSPANFLEAGVSVAATLTAVGFASPTVGA